jgi:hypothetical protein
MRPKTIALSLFALALLNASAQLPIEVQPVKELKRTGSLGTCGYAATQHEAEFYKKLSHSEIKNGSFTDEHEYKIRGKVNTYVGWFGIVRQITKISPDTYDLLLEHKFFDGMTDCHIMLVSYSGGGDFHATLKDAKVEIPILSLVRVYGRVEKDNDEIPQLTADYVRVWPWLTFTFTDLGPAYDHNNPRWAKFCALCGKSRIYRPYPDNDYYVAVLGDPSQFVSPASAENPH